MKDFIKNSWMHFIAFLAIASLFETNQWADLADTPILFRCVVYGIFSAVINAFYEVGMKKLFKIEPQMEDNIAAGIGGLLAPFFSLLPLTVVNIYIGMVLVFVVSFGIYVINKKLQ